jgi:hypothetical protein
MAGSLRSFPQDSRDLYQLDQVKRMIRGLGSEALLTYSQTLNRSEVYVA